MRSVWIKEELSSSLVMALMCSPVPHQINIVYSPESLWLSYTVAITFILLYGILIFLYSNIVVVYVLRQPYFIFLYAVLSLQCDFDNSHDNIPQK